MKIYLKRELKTEKGTLTGSCKWYMHDTQTRETLLIKNFNHFYPLLPYLIDGTTVSDCFQPGNFIIDELEFQEVYDKAIDSLQNFVP